MRRPFLESLFRSRLWKAAAFMLLVGLVVTLAILGSWVGGLSSFLLSITDPAAIMLSRKFDDAYRLGLVAVAILAFLALAALADLYFEQAKTRRFGRMAELITAFSSGDRRVRLSIEGERDERELAESFNRTAEVLCQHLERLEKLDEFRRELISYVAHDLGGPVTSIQGCGETLAAECGASAPDVTRVRRMCDVIGANARYLGALVHSLAELSRLDQADFRPAREVFSVHTLALDVASRFAGQAEEAGLELTVAEPARGILVSADMALIERVFTNLLTNALRHTPSGGSVRVSISNGNARAMVHVIDTGCGISKADVPFIFEQFYRVERDRSRRSGGSGLGLAIARRILAAHGCAIGVESSEGNGANFWFELPLAQANGATAGRNSSI